MGWFNGDSEQLRRKLEEASSQAECNKCLAIVFGILFAIFFFFAGDCVHKMEAELARNKNLTQLLTLREDEARDANHLMVVHKARIRLLESKVEELQSQSEDSALARHTIQRQLEEQDAKLRSVIQLLQARVAELEANNQSWVEKHSQVAVCLEQLFFGLDELHIALCVMLIITCVMIRAMVSGVGESDGETNPLLVWIRSCWAKAERSPNKGQVEPLPIAAELKGGGGSTTEVSATPMSEGLDKAGESVERERQAGDGDGGGPSITEGSGDKEDGVSVAAAPDSEERTEDVQPLAGHQSDRTSSDPLPNCDPIHLDSWQRLSGVDDASKPNKAVEDADAEVIFKEAFCDDTWTVHSAAAETTPIEPSAGAVGTIPSSSSSE